MLIEPAIPKLIPEGHYLFEIVSNPEKKPNTFGSGYYYEFKFYIKDERGEHWNFTGIFTRKQDKFHELLLALGGTRDEKGFTQLPDTNFVGKKFEADIIQRSAKNDPNKTVNDIINISPVKIEPQTSPNENSDPDNSEVESSGEVIPF